MSWTDRLLDQLSRPPAGWVWLGVIVVAAVLVALTVEVLDRRDDGQRQVDDLARRCRR